MQVIKYPNSEELELILKRPVQDLKKIKKIVKPILKAVKRKGDRALIKFALEYDHAEINQLDVTEIEISEAIRSVDPELKNAIVQAKNNIEKFHLGQVQSEQVTETMPGVTCYRKSVAIENVGLYVPGGSAPLFSTVLMLGIPAQIAGCKEIVLCTPPNRKGNIHPAILYAADLIGITKIRKVGGAQAIAAMAYGTDAVPKVDKIFGPGNQYVTAAKQIVSQKGVAIDMLAGPSEVAILADETALPQFVAADLLSQAEHGIDSQVLLISTNEKVISSSIESVRKQLETLPRKKIAEQSIQNSVAILVKTESNAIEIINKYAAEHLILAVKDADSVSDQITNAGSVFLGNYTPESAGDYASGTNHTLPTNGSANVNSGVSVDSFVKKITFQRITKDGIKLIGPIIEKMAAEEELVGHKEAVSERLNYLDQN